jgi:hypothetical protein
MPISVSISGHILTRVSVLGNKTFRLAGLCVCVCMCVYACVRMCARGAPAQQYNRQLIRIYCT